MSDTLIKLDLDPIVRLQCLCTDCANNLYWLGKMECNLKHIEIDAEAKCMNFDPREADKESS